MDDGGCALDMVRVGVDVCTQRSICRARTLRLGCVFRMLAEVAVTNSDRPFWLPERLLEQRLAEGLETLCNTWKC